MLSISQRDFIILPTNWLPQSVNSVMGSPVLENMLNIPSATALNVTDFKGMASGHLVAMQTNVNVTFSKGSLQASLRIIRAFLPADLL